VALPYPVHTRTFYYLTDPRNSLPLQDTLVCNIPIKWHNTAFRARVAVFLALADSTPLVDPISVLRNLIPIKIYITVMTVIGRKKKANVDT
jgi:hypothetical protein